MRRSVRVGLGLLLGLAIVTAVGLRACGFDRRCITMNYPNHCEGPIALQCQGGWGNFAPVVYGTDCRHTQLGPGVCVELPSPSGDSVPFVGCRVVCDPATYTTHCQTNAAIICHRDTDRDPFQVMRWECPYGCAMRTDKTGAKRAKCLSGPGESDARDEPPEHE